MLLKFELRVYSGKIQVIEEDNYGVVLKIPKSKALNIVNKNPYSYVIDENLFADISVSQVDFKKAQELRKKSKGFGSYVWMVDSILSNGIIERPSRYK